MKSLEYFLNQLREQREQLEQFVTSVSREEKPESAPVCADLAISLMCCAPARNHSHPSDGNAPRNRY